VYTRLAHVLELEQEAFVHVSVVNLSVSDPLGLADRANRVIPLLASNELALETVGDKCNAADNALVLVQTVSIGKGKDVEQLLGLTQTVVAEGAFLRWVTTMLGLIQSGTYQLEGPSCLVRQYRPFVGFSGDEGTTPPSVTSPILADATLTLTYPYVSPTLTVVLRNPDFANKDNLTFNRVNRTTRGGILIVFADPNWPKVQKLSVQVSALRSPQVADLRTFFALSLGKEVGLLDHENRQWRGIIINPDTPILNPEHGDYSVSFEFEGELC
jgi:hypothetical protein